MFGRAGRWLGRGLTRGLARGLTRAEPIPVPPAFDAVLDLDPRSLPPGTGSEAAIAAVRAAVSQEAGLRRLSVRVRDAPAPIVLRIFAPGTTLESQGAAWSALRDRLYAAARQAIGPVGDPQPAPGFAEALAPSQLSGLEALAALARDVRSVPADAPSPPRSPAPADVERLVRLLRFVLPADDRATALRAVERFGSYAAVLAAPASELFEVKGLGLHCVAAIRLVHEAAIRLGRAAIAAQPVLDDGARLADYLTSVLARERIEQFRVLFLDRDGMLLADEVQARGTVNHTPVYPREVVRRALELGAAELVLVHNHPSGDPTPSREDIAMTRQVRLAASALDIGLRDHVIVGNGRVTSFRDAGLLS